MTGFVESHRSFVNTWECDDNAHMNVQFYFKRFDEAVAVAESAEVAVVCVGGKSGLTPSCTVGEFRDAARTVLMRQKRQGHEPARPEPYRGLQRAVIDGDLAVAAEPEGAHRHRVDHGPVAPDRRALRIDARPASVEDRDVGRRPADIRNDGIVFAREVMCADEARRGP